MRDPLYDRETFLQKLICGYDFIDESYAESFLSVDMIADETIAERIFESRKQGPHKTRVGAVANLGLRKDGVVSGDRDMGE